MRELGLTPVLAEQRSHIAVADLPEPVPGLGEAFEAVGVKAAVNGRRLRIGVHYFNTADDINRMTAVLKDASSAR